MKKIILIIISIILALILSTVTYFYIWGGKPRIKNFDDISRDYETIAKLSLEYYNQSSHKDERITLVTYDDYLKDSDGNIINLTDEQIEALKTVNQRFDYGCLWVTNNSVIFWRDETKYYGLVYSKNPLLTIWDIKTDWYDSVEYHRINSKWYEIGNFGM